MPPAKTPKQPKQGRSVYATASPDAAPLDPHAKKQETLNLGDSMGLKRALDDAVVEVLQAEGWVLDYSLIDLKLGVGLLACLVALVGQFYPKRQPETTAVLLACVALYALLSAALTAIASLLERDVIAMTKAGPGAGAPPRVALASRLPRFQDTYTLRVWPRDSARAGGGNKPGSGGSSAGLASPRGTPAPLPGELRLSKSVAGYFTADGLLAAEVIKADAKRLLRQLAAAGEAASESSKDK